MYLFYFFLPQDLSEHSLSNEDVVKAIENVRTEIRIMKKGSAENR